MSPQTHAADQAVSPPAALHTVACPAKATRGRIWIDLDNSPHVPFFAPIIEELRNRNYQILLTARDCFQVRELADLFHLNYKVIGRHFGRNTIWKLGGLALRALQLIPVVLRERPALALSCCSRAQLIVSSLLRIPSLLIGDYEFATPWVLLRPTWHMTPDVIPTTAISFCDPERILKYPGIKEDVYVPRFVPDPSIRSQLGLREEEIVVTLRPPASEAHYHNPESDELFEAVITLLSDKPDVRLVVLPRNDKQAGSIRCRWPYLFATSKMLTPAQAVNGLNLIWHSDLVISAGGTMNREAAALGVPVYSIFRGHIGAVDRYLSNQGRLALLESVHDVRTKIALVRNDRQAARRTGNPLALSSIVSQIVGMMESPGHKGYKVATSPAA